MLRLSPWDTAAAYAVRDGWRKWYAAQAKHSEDYIERCDKEGIKLSEKERAACQKSAEFYRAQEQEERQRINDMMGA